MINFFKFWEKKKKDNIIIPLKPGEIPNENNSDDMWTNIEPINLNKIRTVNFPEDQYYRTITDKTQIVLHHTVSGEGVNGDIATWEATPERVATCIIIDRSGIPWQLFSSKYWAYHIGLNNSSIEKRSIGIELDNWGWLIPGDGTDKVFYDVFGNSKEVTTDPNKFYTYYGNAIYAVAQYYPNGFKGYNYYEKYTNEQIKTAGELILYWHKIYGIPLNYNEDMWNVSERAKGGDPGIWTHVSYRMDKSDTHPQPELISMLKKLSSFV